MKHKATMIYHDSYEMIKFLTVEEKGLLFEAIMDYDVKGIEPELPNRFLEYAFMSFKKQLDASREHYEQVCRNRGKNAKKRWENGEEEESTASDDDAMQKDANALKKDANALQKDANRENTNTNTNTKTNTNTNTNTKTKTKTKTNTLVCVSKGDEEAEKLLAATVDTVDTHTEKRTYGEFDNVFLSDSEYKRLTENYSDAKKRIDGFSAYLRTSGKDYKDHYAMLINWRLYGDSRPAQIPEVTKKPPGERREPTFDISEFTKKAIGIKYVMPEE